MINLWHEKTFTATMDDNWLQHSWFSILTMQDTRCQLLGHSNCSKYIYSKGVIDNTVKHWADVVIT